MHRCVPSPEDAAALNCIGTGTGGLPITQYQIDKVFIQASTHTLDYKTVANSSNQSFFAGDVQHYYGVFLNCWNCFASPCPRQAATSFSGISHVKLKCSLLPFSQVPSTIG